MRLIYYSFCSKYQKCYESFYNVWFHSEFSQWTNFSNHASSVVFYTMSVRKFLVGLCPIIIIRTVPIIKFSFIKSFPTHKEWQFSFIVYMPFCFINYFFDFEISFICICNIVRNRISLIILEWRYSTYMHNIFCVSQ